MPERVQKMTDEVLCLKYSKNQKYLAASLLDSTVKVFFADSLKFYLSLYGHKVRAPQTGSSALVAVADAPAFVASRHDDGLLLR